MSSTTMFILSFLSILLSFIAPASTHTTAWTKGMYCKNGLSNEDAPNADYSMEPLWNETYSQWFMHGPCRNYPPPAGEFLELPAGGQFLAELSPNRAFTSLSYGGSKVTGWGDGKKHPDNYSTTNLGGFGLSGSGCILSPNLHAHSPADAAGTVFAIAYKSDLGQVTMADLTVFTVASNTPWMTHAYYDVPADMPACPPGGCICAWGWVPNHCGQSNVYMTGYRCMVTGAKADAPKIAAPKAPVWCEDDQSRCVTGAKQMVIYYQAQANTITIPQGCQQKDGQWCSPGYNTKMGFHPGAQNDIFETAAPAKVSAAAAPTSTKAASSAKPTTESCESSKAKRQEGTSKAKRHERAARRRLLMGL